MLMAEERNVLRWVSWRDCCPWIMLFRTFSVSITVRALLLATVGSLVTWLGWLLIGLLLLGGEATRSDAPVLSQGAAFARFVDRNEARPGIELAAEAPAAAKDDSLFALDTQQRDRFEALLRRAFDPVAEDELRIAPPRWRSYLQWLPREPVFAVWRKTTDPFVHLFNPKLDFWGVLYALSGGMWTLGVWSFVGGAISRIAVVQLGREERVGLVESLRYACRYWLSYLGGPLFPLVGLFLLAIPFMILGWIMQAGDWGIAVSGIFWFLIVLCGLPMAILALGAMFGWPLMWGTISTEGSDAFDSLSRCFAYTFQRPLHYAFYVVVVTLFGGLCWLIVSLFANLTIDLTYWAASWGAYEARVNNVFGQAMQEGPAFNLGSGLIVFWTCFVQAVATSWFFAFFFAAMGGVYLLIRRDVDQTETDEIYIEEEDESYGMPPLTKDESGVPVAADMPDAQENPQPPPGDDPPPATETPAADGHQGDADATEGKPDQ
jgi:hypothetical protein